MISNFASIVTSMSSLIHDTIGHIHSKVVCLSICIYVYIQRFVTTSYWFIRIEWRTTEWKCVSKSSTMMTMLPPFSSNVFGRPKLTVYTKLKLCIFGFRLFTDLLTNYSSLRNTLFNSVFTVCVSVCVGMCIQHLFNVWVNNIYK